MDIIKILAEEFKLKEEQVRATVELIDEGKITMKVLSSPDKWFGVTYAADKPLVVSALKAMTESGRYPDGLWK